MLDDVKKNLVKNGQKEVISTSIGNSMGQKKQLNKEKVEEAGESKRTSVKVEMGTVSEEIGNSVKGQFGKQVKEAIKTQSEKLDNF